MNRLVTRNSLFDDFFREVPGFFVRPLHGDPLPETIRLDVKEAGNSFVVSAEVPGVSKENIHVDIDGNEVSIRAEVKQEDAQTEDERVLRSERFFGAVARSISLPAEIDESASKARYEHGVLTLTLPKKIRTGQARITIE